MKSIEKSRWIRNILAVVAVLLGTITLFAGVRVILGFDPGYHVFLPLLLFNTAMGVVYLIAGAAIWRNLKWGGLFACAIFFCNLCVLAVIVVLYRQGWPVAVESIRAMMFRTVVWLLLFLAAIYARRIRS